MINKQYLIDNNIKLTHDNTIIFWNPKKENGFLSQWYHSEFTLFNVDYTCAEQCMMFYKALLFNDVWSGLLISKQYKTPKMYKELGRNVKNFDQKIWDENKVKIVWLTNIAKFTDNKELTNMLLDTGNKYLIEASPYDNVWGIGLTAHDPKRFKPNEWNGENLLGFTLMRVRDCLMKHKKINENKDEVLTE